MGLNDYRVDSSEANLLKNHQKLYFFFCWPGHLKMSFYYPTSHEQGKGVEYLLLVLYSMIVLVAGNYTLNDKYHLLIKQTDYHFPMSILLLISFYQKAPKLHLRPVQKERVIHGRICRFNASVKHGQ